MRRNLAVWPAIFALALALTACGDDDGDSGSSDVVTDGGASAPAATGDGESPGSTNSGAVVDPAEPGHATARVDGLDFAFDLPGALDCTISDDVITISYRIGDNEVSLGGGLNRDDRGWFGNIVLRVANPDAEPGPISYYPTPGEAGAIDQSRIAVDGQSMSYSGPMLKQPPNDGSNPAPVDAGDGTISATCE